jgi:hypothetical protein
MSEDTAIDELIRALEGEAEARARAARPRVEGVIRAARPRIEYLACPFCGKSVIPLTKASSWANMNLERWEILQVREAAGGKLRPGERRDKLAELWSRMSPRKRALFRNDFEYFSAKMEERWRSGRGRLPARGFVRIPGAGLTLPEVATTRTEVAEILRERTRRLLVDFIRAGLIDADFLREVAGEAGIIL